MAATQPMNLKNLIWTKTNWYLSIIWWNEIHYLVFPNEPKSNRNEGIDVRKVLCKCGEDPGRIVLVMV